MSLIPKKRAKLEGLNEEDEKTANWFDLPFELREMIIDEMDVKTRCTFAKCSKLCEKEAKESNNYLHTIELLYDNGPCVFFHFEPFSEDPENAMFVVHFKDMNNPDSIQPERCDFEVMIDGNEDEAIARFLQKHVEKYRKCLRYLWIQGRDYNAYLPKINFNILRKLEQCHMSFPNVAEFSSIIGGDKILRTQDVSLYFLNLTFDQILKFQGGLAHIRSNEMDEENVKQYLKMLKNGEVHQNIESITIHMKYEKQVNFGNVVEGLDVDRFRSFESGCSFTMTSKSEENKSRIFTVSYKPTSMLSIQCQ